MIYNEDCIKTIERLLNESINLVVTSPPYSDMMSYGKNVENKKEDDYIKWICLILNKLFDKVSKDGSIIINIGEKIINGLRSTYIFRLICEIEKITKWKIYDVYIWEKKNCLPNGSNKRLNHNHEYIIHLSKSKIIKAFGDKIREPYSESSKIRFKYKIDGGNELVSDEGLNHQINKNKGKKYKINPLGKIPFSVLKFETASKLKKMPTGKHPAPFHPDLPEFFIKWLTEENDVVYDPFMGSGTTAYACIINNRNYIGSELNENYLNLIDEWITIAKEKQTNKKNYNNTLNEMFGE